MARKIWKSIRPRKFCGHVSLCPSAPQGNHCEVSHFQASRVQNVCYIRDCLHLCLSNPILGGLGAVSWVGRKGATKVFKHEWKSPWVPTLTGPFPEGQANALIGHKKCFVLLCPIGEQHAWVPFVSSYTTAVDSTTACLSHVPKKCMQLGNFQFDINSPFQILFTRKLKTLFQ